ncbi:tyrosine--tRNA ligase [Candidatus Woesearchaeota archaeon]|nr:tyrosine--tRNA ligase [Candidatus Woesearchaeota archaeon]
MDIDGRLGLVRQVGEEIVTEEDLKALLAEKRRPIAYDGFEPSGRIHIAQAVLRATNINKMTRAGCRFTMLLADWHGWANNKMGGDLERIRTVGRYFIEVWKASGMDLDNVRFVWASDLVKEEAYWRLVMRIAIQSTLKRILRCGQIMGRKESEVLQASQILYPCMQAADIFHLKADICQLGMDQRKVNVLARELAPRLGERKPVIVSHHMLMGLQRVETAANDAAERAIEMKMSKSNPDSAIFMTDSADEIRKKLQKAYCPEKQVRDNPLLEYAKYIVFERFPDLTVERPKKFGGDITFSGYAALEKAYAEGSLHPMDLKGAVAVAIDEVIAPVRRHFERSSKARELLEQVDGFQVTR